MTETTLRFITKADTSGADAISQKFTQITRNIQEVSNQSVSTSTNMEGLFKRIERPLGRTLFSGLAGEMLGATEGAKATSGAMVALERGLHAVAIGAMFAGGEFAAVILIGASLIAMIMKIADSASDAQKKIQDHGAELHKDAVAAREAAKNLSDLHLVNEKIVKQLQDISALKQKEFEDLVKEVAAKKAVVDANVANLAAQIKADKFTGGEGLNARIEYNKALKEQAALLTTLQSLGGTAGKKEEKPKKDNEELIRLQAERILIQEKLRLSSETLAQAQIELDTAQIKLKNDEQAMVALGTQATEKQLKQAHDRIEADNREIQVIKERVNETEKALKKEESFYKAFAKNVLDRSEAFWKDFIQGNKQNLDKDVANFIDGEANKLYAMAMVDIFDPLKAGLGAAEFAGATALMALAGKFGDGGSTPGVGAPPSPGMGTSPGSAVGGRGSQGAGTTVQFIIQGGFIGDINQAAANHLAQAVAQAVSTGGAVSSQFINGSPVPV